MFIFKPLKQRHTVAEFEGNIRKMRSALSEEVDYALPLYDNLNPNHEVNMTNLVGETIQLSYGGEINCVVTGKRIKKAFNGTTFSRC